MSELTGTQALPAELPPPPDMQPEEAQGPKAIELPAGITADWIISRCKNLRKDFLEWFQPELARINENNKIYELKPISEQVDGSETLPLGTSIVDTTQSKIVGAFVNQDKFVDAAPKDDQAIIATDSEAQAGLVEDYVNEDIQLTPDFVERCDKLVHLMLIENGVVAEVKWEEILEERATPEYRERLMDKTQVYIGDKQYEKDCSRPVFNPDSITNYGWDPRAENISKSPYAWKRVMTTINELKEQEAKGIVQDIDKVTGGQKIESAGGGSGAAPSDVNDPQAQQSQMVEGKKLPDNQFGDRLIPVDEWWADVIYTDGEGENKQVKRGRFQYWIADEKTLIKFRVNPLKPMRNPFIHVKISKKTVSALGQGPLDVIKPIMRNISSVLASKNKLLRQTAGSPIFYEPVTMLDAKRTFMEENNLVPVLSTKGIDRLPPPVEAIAILDKHLGFLIQQAREATAANEQAQGIEMKGGTATEAEILMQASSNRTQYMISMLAWNFFVPLASHYLALRQQFSDPESLVLREAGLDGAAKKLSLQDIAGYWEFRPVLSITTSQKLNRFKLLKEMLVELSKAPAGFFKNGQGQVMETDNYEFLTRQMLPLIDIPSGRGLFKVVAPTIPTAAAPMMQGAPAAPAASAPLAPAAQPQPEPTAEGGGIMPSMVQ